MEIRRQRLRLAVAFALVASSIWLVNAAEARGTVEFSSYSYELSSGEAVPAQIGTLVVPTHRGMPDAPTTQIKFVRLVSTGERPGPPIIYLAGGPGSSGIEAGRGDRWKLFDALRRQGDVILLDQRGVGMSSPPAQCSTPWSFPNDTASTEANMSASLEAAAAVCAAEWRKGGTDLSMYNTAENAADVADLIMALGGRARLVGISYGTFLAFAVLRDHSTLVARVVLAGTEGPDHTLKLPLQADRVLDGLSKKAREANPAQSIDMRRAFTSVMARLAIASVSVETKDRSGAAVRVVVSQYDVQTVVAFLMATSENAKRLPDMITAMNSGDYTGVARNVLALRRFLAPLPAMPLAMDAASPVSESRRRKSQAQVARSVFGNAVNWPEANFARALGIEQLGTRWRKPLRTNVPALFISGDLDSRTPPANANEVRRGFRSSKHLVLVGAGHDNDLFLSSPKIIERISAFLDGERLSNEEIFAVP